MKRWLKKLFGARPLIVEVQAPRKLDKPDEAMRDAILSLQAHPGFQYLLAKLRYQRHLLETALLTQRQENLADVEFIQSGINWLRWLQDQLEVETKLKTRQAVQQPTAIEEATLKQVMDQFEVVGQD